MGTLRKFGEDAVGNTSETVIIQPFDIPGEGPAVDVTPQSFIVTSKTPVDVRLQESTDAGSSWKTRLEIRIPSDSTTTYEVPNPENFLFTGKAISGVEQNKLRAVYQQDSASRITVTMLGKTSGRDFKDA